ncbi:unnamed protein product [Tuber aestivum]|uniref:non-specific serine/threonine protein kinase n=1 Tax=Tuber aestivum TaxID=59557 RepID=A0A292PM43_9PEZI|nr:unnamed protein product [Tuber aestivum]
MSLIPYSSNDTRSVVLRHQQTLVVYDPQSRQLALCEASSPLSPPAPVEFCPLCKRPLGDDSHREDGSPDRSAPGMGHRTSGSMAESGFVDQEYFRMLGSGMPVTDEPGEPEAAMRRQPPSPTRRRLPRAEVEEEDEDGDMDEELVAGSAPPAAGGISEAAFSPKYFERFFVIEKELGRGGTGVVLLVRHLLDGVSLGHFACKRVPVGDNHKWLEKVLMEVQLLQQLSHTNLVSYRHVWLENVHLTTFGPSVPCAFILQQYCNSGDLHNYLLSAAKQTTKEQLKDQMRRRSRGEPDPSLDLNKPRKLPFEQIISFFRDIASGLNHLHSNGFIHRDLKPSNCLLNDTGVPGQELRVLVSDFGEVQMESAARKSTGATGTISYCAPEVLRKVAPGGEYENFTAKSDIFSLGMILYFMCFGNLPYVGADMMNEENENLDTLREEIMAWPGLDERTRLRPDLPERLYQSLMALISPDPSVRPTAEEILMGIEMQEGTPLRRGSSVSQKKPAIVADDRNLIGFRRISPVADTPPPSTPVGSPSMRQGYDTFKRSPKPRPVMKVPKRASRLGVGSRPGESPASGSVISTQIARDSESSLVLRSRLEAMKSPGVLPGVVPWRIRTGVWLARAQWYLLLKLGTFLIKVATLTGPCSPSATKPCFFYPLLSVAALDFATPSFFATIILLAVHVVVLLLVNAFGSVCMVKAI